LDEFDALIYQDDINLVPVHQNEDLSDFDALILPGSKNSGVSLTYLNNSGLDKQIQAFKITGKLILGICGGLQILGKQIFDPLHIEDGDKQGLALIDLQTEICADKSTRQTTLSWLDSSVTGYEIHHGKTVAEQHVLPFMQEGLGWQQENIYSTYLHGVFDNKVFYNWFMKQVGGRENGIEWHAHIEYELNKLAQMFDQHGWL